MAEGSGLETYANHTNAQSPSAETNGVASSQTGGDTTLKRALLFVALAAASAAIVFAIVRATLSRTPADPTTERIQQLIDEANRLLKQLDDKKPE
jgi:hypothetical protein